MGRAQAGPRFCGADEEGAARTWREPRADSARAARQHFLGAKRPGGVSDMNFIKLCTRTLRAAAGRQRVAKSKDPYAQLMLHDPGPPDRPVALPGNGSSGLEIRRGAVWGRSAETGASVRLLSLRLGDGATAEDRQRVLAAVERSRRDATAAVSLALARPYAPRLTGLSAPRAGTPAWSGAPRHGMASAGQMSGTEVQ